MNFSKILSAIWQHRKSIAIGLVVLAIVTFFVSTSFQMYLVGRVNAGMIIIEGLIKIALYLALVAFGLSLIWKHSVRNVKGGSGKKK
jgi:hypothetical protein